MKNVVAVSAAGLVLLLAVPASAAVVTEYVGADLTVAPYTIDLGTGSLTFSTVDPSFFAFNPTGVQTSGTVQVFSLGAPFYPEPTPTSYFTDRGGEFGPGQLGFFASYATPTAIPFSIATGLVGFGFTLNDGLHYGYAQIGGSVLTGFRYETEAGVGVALGEIAAVPEPTAWALMILGFGMSGLVVRRRRLRATIA